MIKTATFVSIWNGGEYSVSSTCKVDTVTKKVFDITPGDCEDFIEALDNLDKEIIIIDNEEFEVFNEDENEPGDYWYEL